LPLSTFESLGQNASRTADVRQLVINAANVFIDVVRIAFR
jgi:hypothetical protein